MSKGKIGIAVAVVVVAAGFYWWWSRRTPEIHWRTSTVERGPIQVTVTSTGSLAAVDTVDVGTQVSGIISELDADFNSHVKKGQVIARIDTTTLHASLQSAIAELASAQAQSAKADSDLNRAKPLFAKGLVDQADLDQAVANAKVAAASVQSARADLERAHINLRYATITSPIDGIVLDRAVNLGQTVAASFNTPTLFLIAKDLHQMQVLASVDEADIGQVKVGQHVTFTVDAYPDTEFTGTVNQIRLAPIVSSNVVTYNVVIGVANPALKLMQGMTANLTIVVKEKKDVLLVPAAAMQFQAPAMLRNARSKAKPDSTGRHAGGAWAGAAGGNGAASQPDESRGHVFLLQNGQLKFTRVHTGLSDGTKTEIEGAVNAGDTVVIGVETIKGGGSAKPFGMEGHMHGGFH